MPHMLIHMHHRARRQRGHLITNRKRHTPRDRLHKNRVGRLMIRQHLAGQKRKKNQICTIPLKHPLHRWPLLPGLRLGGLRHQVDRCGGARLLGVAKGLRRVYWNIRHGT